MGTHNIQHCIQRMGNKAAGSTVNWSTLVTTLSANSDEPSAGASTATAAELIERLSIELPISDDEKVSESALEEQLDAYLAKLSDAELQALFLRFGVNADFAANASRESKVSALRRIASLDFWRTHWEAHPLR